MESYYQEEEEQGEVRRQRRAGVYIRLERVSLAGLSFLLVFYRHLLISREMN